MEVRQLEVSEVAASLPFLCAAQDLLFDGKPGAQPRLPQSQSPTISRGRMPV